jgi:hypothetical protein
MLSTYIYAFDGQKVAHFPLKMKNIMDTGILAFFFLDLEN